ncbi:Disease resistance protein RPM1 [Dichanthelium oligosanthes]|uniref:Disease resistance protein RPM1 n=1 Tax=Dichanthelium oligosanthes TaxID=888268 RepID=A0A1E5VK68_9POAL|nr:Disease resistance protein RPM1 [Dichanthelium oligosanthes]
MARASLAGGTMASLAVKLNSILMPKYELMTGARTDVLFLRAELESMHAFLERLSTVRDPDAQVRAWTKEVRELAYNIEDTMDEFMHRVDAHGGVATNHGQNNSLRGLASRVMRLTSKAWTHLRLANELKGLKARTVEVSERRSRYKYNDDTWVSGDHMAADPRINVLYADVPDLVGVDGPMSDIVEWLMGGTTTTLKVLSVVGFGGLGKTTLAMEVFRRVGGQFGCRAFAAVSQKLDTKKLLKDLLSQIAGEEVDRMDTWEEGQLIRKLRECLLNRRYLIIIDDVWSKSAWEKVRCALPQNNHNSRILTTTRIESVAKLCCSDPDDRVYRIEPLNESDSKVLFFKRIFGDKEGCPPQLKEVSDQILKKCCGSPLAIISIASLLASKPVMLKEQWEKLLVSIGSALEKNPDLEGMKQILSLSYYDLPYHLKTCLLYLSLYPEDFKIERDSLIQQWIAEGFVGVERGLSVEDVAEGYFNELINRSMVQPTDINCDGRAHACRVHDVMLELIVSKAIEENFVTLVSGHSVPTSFAQGNVRRLSIQCDSEISKIQGEMNLYHVRTLTSFVQATLVPPLSEFRVLRVLNLEGCQGFSENHLKEINNLFHLKYLSLRRTWVSNLPPQIGDLQTLETLDIRDTNIEELPGTITRLEQLKYIISGGHTWGKIKLPDGVGNMASLRGILGFDICRSSACAVQELGNLKSLMELAINWTDFTSGNVKHQEAMMRTLGKLGTSNLQSFAVCSRNFGSLEFLSSWSPPPNHLQKFRLSA